MADALSKAIGQQLIIETDVKAIVAPISHLTVIGVTIPSEGIDGTNLAELKLLELDVDLFALLSGSLRIDNIRIDGIRIILETQADGTKSWKDAPAAPQNNEGPAPLEFDVDNSIVAFLDGKDVNVTSVSLNVDNQVTGFEYLFELDTLSLKQENQDEGQTLASHGTVNGQPFQIQGNFPRGAQFTTAAALGQVTASFDGHRLPAEQGGGFAGQLALDIGDIGEFLEVVKLNRSMEGSGNLSMRLVRQGKMLAVEDLRTVVDFQNGTNITLEGSAEDLMKSLDFDFRIDGRFFPEGQPPKRATELSDLELTTVEARLISEGEKLRFEDVLVETNFFESTFEEIGPLSVGRIQRTEQGGLAMRDVYVQIGPRESPYVTANGDIEDLLGFMGLTFAGTMSAPASLVLDEFQNDSDQAFGGVKADFEVSDATGQLSLSKLEARSENTELWTMRASAKVNSFTDVEGVDFELNFDIPNGDAFLAALQLDKVDLGKVAVFTSVSGSEAGLETKLSVGVGDSRVDTVLLTVVDKNQRSTVRGTIHSEQVNIHDLDKAIEAAVLLVSHNGEAKQGAASGKNNREVQPLVLEDQIAASESGSLPDAAADGRVIQPLVLEAGPAGKGKASDLLNLEQIGRDLDLEIGLEIERIVGQAGVSKVSSELVSKDGKADFGPLEINYGGGHFKIGAGVDFIDSPQFVRVFGATGGWDLGEILDEIGLGIQAHGKLQGRFDLTGRYASARNFINTMHGSVTISMANGNIATSLLDLAGLGLFPWLFSKELQQGYTTIVCAVAPLHINGGKASSNAIVIETKSVQLVAAGTIDWRNDRISMRAEPRPVGRPLARSAWPFEVTGRLSSPDFKIGGKSKQKTKNRTPFTSQPSGARTPCKPDTRQSQ